MNLATQRLGRALGGALLNLAAIGGVLCIAAVILAAVFNLSLVMFKTGSMSPAIPAGSLALVRELPATEIRIGDVITVDRTDALPITHRVVAIGLVDAGSSADGTDAGNAGNARSLTLRGDANTTDDPQPYRVTRARIVLFSVPGLASTVAALSQGPVMIVITLAAAALVTWAFWPRRVRESS